MSTDARDAAGLAGGVALVTGASSGLGRATALRLARAGADVALLARSAADLAEASAAVEGEGRRALALACDLADAGSVEDAVRETQERLGAVGVLVNAAGTDVPGAVTDLSVEAWDRVQAVNLRAVFLLCRRVLPGMAEAGRGTIVNISSVAGKRGWANASAYCASKFALTGFTQALAAEAREHGVRACVLYPGAMATNWGTWSAEDRDADPAASTSPQEALAPETVAELIAFIATAPPELVLNEVVVSPLQEQGWP
ncbi:MAG: 3-oxoacyl-[acyl-carrier protein] reductase [uncultured Solirubrobacteraceae bacterium]|uniref:3-oxoacyl-[acyl-carrier protein] reductase n=1 Tax=uncultured Solirubrobacteraceae bacterium TaxID=1162706 RepID=A0A6J4R9Y7_9ACTN|nr:MAG: 3-oxoacyl-[acyl-carrier protein] reductase [uncultured Solirubrobacteraceae bacterium]